jgi:hypothetical protein
MWVCGGGVGGRWVVWVAGWMGRGRSRAGCKHQGTGSGGSRLRRGAQRAARRQSPGAAGSVQMLRRAANTAARSAHGKRAPPGSLLTSCPQAAPRCQRVHIQRSLGSCRLPPLRGRRRRESQLRGSPFQRSSDTRERRRSHRPAWQSCSLEPGSGTWAASLDPRISYSWNAGAATAAGIAGRRSRSRTCPPRPPRATQTCLRRLMGSPHPPCSR